MYETKTDITILDKKEIASIIHDNEVDVDKIHLGFEVTASIT